MAFSEIKKNYWHRESTLDSLLQRRGPPHLCALERGCRKHNTNGSGITLNIQMGKLIVYAWIHHCDYLAPLASLPSSLKATQAAFCFRFGSIKKFRPHNETLSPGFTPHIHANTCYFLCYNNVWLLCKVQIRLLFCDKHPQRGAHLRWQRRKVLPPYSWCKYARFLWLLHQCCHFVHAAIIHKNIKQQSKRFILQFWTFQDVLWM